MSLRAKNVSFTAGGRRLVRNFDLAVETGEILMLAGNNGAGKTTLLSLLAGCPTPNEGGITLEGRPLASWPPDEFARRRAILPQSPSLAFDFTVAEVVRFGALPHRVGDNDLSARMQETMQWMDVVHLAGRGCFSLSGGERQRVHLARVLLQVQLARNVPRYLLLDEPLAAMDLAHQYRLMELLRERTEAEREGGLGVVVVTHDLSIALRYADRVCLLRAGRCHAVGGASAVITPENVRAVFEVEAEVTPQAVVTRPL